MVSKQVLLSKFSTSLAQWFKAGNSAYERLGGRYSYSANEWNIPCAPGNAVNYKFSDAMGTRTFHNCDGRY